MARPRFLKRASARSMPRADASPPADRDVVIKRVDLDAPANAAGALRRYQDRPAAQKRIEHDVARTFARCLFIATYLCHLILLYDQDTRLGYTIQTQSVFTATAQGLFQATASSIRWFSTRYPGFSEPSSVLQCARKTLWDQDRSKILGPSQAR